MKRMLGAAVRQAALRCGLEVGPSDATLSKRDHQILEAVSAFTMTSRARVMALLDAVRYVVHEKVAGDVVECGVWRGGSIMAAALAFVDIGDVERDLYLFDTFEGMPTSGWLDQTIARRFTGWLGGARLGRRHKAGWIRASMEDVKRNVGATGYPAERLHFIRGKVEQTLPAQAPGRVAILRLDTDWYESPKWELEQLYDRLSPRGVLIVDDYGHWAGARRAVDEFFLQHPHPRPYLHRIDYTARLAIKPDKDSGKRSDRA